MFDSDYIKVFSGSVIEVEHVKQSLEAEGINPIVKPFTGSSAISAYQATDYQELRVVFVHESEVDKANTIISESYPKST